MPDRQWRVEGRGVAWRKLGWLDWGLLAYVVLLAAIGVGVVRLAVTHRRFDSLTVTQKVFPLADSLAATSHAEFTLGEVLRLQRPEAKVERKE